MAETSSATSLTDKVQSALPSAVQDKVPVIAGKAQQVSEQVGAQAREQLTTRSTQAGDQLHAVSKALRNSTTDLKSQGNEASAKVLEPAADKAAQLAAYLQQSSGDQLLRDVEDFGRKQPWAVVGGGLAVGFVVSRFLKASSTKRYETQYRQSASSGWRPKPSDPRVPGAIHPQLEVGDE